MFSNLEYPDEGSNRTAGAQVDPNLCLLQSKCASGASMIYANLWEIEKNRFPQISTEKVTDSHRDFFELQRSNLIVEKRREIITGASEKRFDKYR
jgi:hypothetical protein